MHRRTNLMPTYKKKKTESRTRRTQRVRRTRRCKGGEPCENGIYGYDDNYQCVQAGCDEFKCAKIYHGSKPHKDPEQKNKDKELSELMRELAISSGQKEARASRHKHRKSFRAAPLSSTLNPTNPNPNARHNVTNKTRTIQGWQVQKAWTEGLPDIYESPSYVPPSYAMH